MNSSQYNSPSSFAALCALTYPPTMPVSFYAYNLNIDELMRDYVEINAIIVGQYIVEDLCSILCSMMNRPFGYC